ncbi:MAG: Ppx/GppA family phosphatase [Mariprofundaceae bacterium]|nr:Ppx/GppA family phosphatase [Mariprofundaceae bacterium]
MLHAAVDIGTNTFRLLIARPARNKQASPPWETIYYTHRIVRLGEGLHHSGKLSEACMRRATTALEEFAGIITAHGIKPETVHAVATAAMREAENGEVFRHYIMQQTGLNLCIIEGKSEAAMSLQGAAAVLEVKTRRDMLLFDIGGGSTEFIRAHEGVLCDAISRKLGVVCLVEAYLNSDPPNAANYSAMIAASNRHLDSVEQHWGDGRIPAHLVGTAGTVTTLAAIHLDLAPYDADTINNHVISRSEFFVLRNRLLSLPHDQRQAMRTIEKGRADLMVAGLAIIEAVLTRWNYSKLIVVDAGLLEGAWITANAEASRLRSPGFFHGAAQGIQNP